MAGKGRSKGEAAPPAKSKAKRKQSAAELRKVVAEQAALIAQLRAKCSALESELAASVHTAAPAGGSTTRPAKRGPIAEYMRRASR